MPKTYDAHEIRSLFDRFWVTRIENKELYFSIRRTIPQYSTFINQLLGWNLIVNESVIKLEKVPPRSMPWMGIQNFTETTDYCLLCALLIYLADQEDSGQFLLSSLTETLETYLADVMPIDWTQYSHRKSLVRVLGYAQTIGLLIAYDGNSDGFSASREQEVLYENTGLSRHFAAHFERDILSFRSVEDFEALAYEGDAERGRQRINRVYRRLALAPAYYWSEDDRADYEYIKNQRHWVNKYLDEALCGELQIYKNGAFFVLSEDNRFGLCHPNSYAISDVVLLLCSILREQIQNGAFAQSNDGMVPMTHREFQYQVLKCRALTEMGWGKQLRELPDEKLVQEVLSYMAEWMLLIDNSDHVVICPGAAKWIGKYPKDYRIKNKEGEDDRSLEDA